MKWRQCSHSPRMHFASNTNNFLQPLTQTSKSHRKPSKKSQSQHANGRAELVVLDLFLSIYSKTHYLRCALQYLYQSKARNISEFWLKFERNLHIQPAVRSCKHCWEHLCWWTNVTESSTLVSCRFPASIRVKMIRFDTHVILLCYSEQNTSFNTCKCIALHCIVTSAMLYSIAEYREGHQKLSHQHRDIICNDLFSATGFSIAELFAEAREGDQRHLAR